MDNNKSPYEKLINNVLEKDKSLFKREYKIDNSESIKTQHSNYIDKKAKITLDKSYNKTQNSVKNQRNPKQNILNKVSLQLINSEQILIKPSNKIISSALSQCQNTNYNLKKNNWIFSINDYPMIVELLSKNKFEFEKIPPGTLKIAHRKIPNETFSLNGKIYDKLLDFQREAVLFALNRNGKVLLGDDMGLGKTIQALAIANYYYCEFPLLIISPASLLNNWAEEIKKHLDLDSIVVRSVNDFGNKISIISYNHATTMADIIKGFKYKIIICDESHNLKTQTSKRTRAIVPILQQASRLIMISGTPAESRPLELYPTFCALDKTLFPSFYVFGNRYCNGRKIGDFYDYTGCSNAAELSLIMEKAFMIRRMKNIVLKDLPKKIRKQVFLEVPMENGHEEVDNVDNHMLAEIEKSNIIQEFTKAAELKLPAILKYLKELIKKKKKTVVFAHHQILIDGIEEFCQEEGLGYIRIDGSTVVNKRQEYVAKFQNIEEVKIAILSIKACSTGITLTAGKIAVFTELYWNPGTLLQAEDRIHRIGQISDVEIHYLLGKGTIDEMVWPYIMKKLNVLESLGIGNEEFDYINDLTNDLKQKTLDDFITKTI